MCYSAVRIGNDFCPQAYGRNGTYDESPNGVATGDRTNGIKATGLAREFKGGVRAVDGIDIEVGPGEIYGFLGPNGAGKSTTVHMLTTLLPPTAGSAKVAGFDVRPRAPRSATRSAPPCRRPRWTRS